MMKYIAVILMLITGILSFGRDYEVGQESYRERVSIQEEELEKGGRYAWDMWNLEEDSEGMERPEWVEMHSSRGDKR